MDLQQAILSRRSTRKFLVRPVEAEKIAEILLSARHAPSGGNSQSCHFYVLQNAEKLNELNAIVQSAFAKMEVDENTYRSIVNSVTQSKKGNYRFSYNAPVFIIVANKRGYGNAMADSACALENMMLTANALHLGSCWINQLHWLDENEEVRSYLAKLGVNKEETICGCLSVGYPDTPNGLPPRESKTISGNVVTYIE